MRLRVRSHQTHATRFIISAMLIAVLQVASHLTSFGQSLRGQVQQDRPALNAGALVPGGFAQSLNTLADEPPTHMGFMFDRSMLQAMRNAMQSVDYGSSSGTSRAAASIASVSVDNYRYSIPATYNSQSMASIKASFEAAGWKHLVSSHAPEKYPDVNRFSAAEPQMVDPGSSSAPPDPYGDPRIATQPKPHPATDLWLHFTGTDVDGIVVLTRGIKDMSVVQVACDLRPIDLLHIGGHFGIPKVDPNVVMMPDPGQN